MAGFVQNQRYRHRELTPEQLQAFSEVVSALTVLSDEWKAVQAWARLDMCMTGTSTEGSEDMVKTVEAVTLTVEAVNGRGSPTQIIQNLQFRKRGRWHFSNILRIAVNSRQPIRYRSRGDAQRRELSVLRQ